MQVLYGTLVPQQASRFAQCSAPEAGGRLRVSMVSCGTSIALSIERHRATRVRKSRRERNAHQHIDMLKYDIINIQPAEPWPCTRYVHSNQCSCCSAAKSNVPCLILPWLSQVPGTNT